MAVYVIVGYDIADPSKFEGYVPGLLLLHQNYGGEVVAADFESVTLEGEARKVNVVFKFPSEEAVRNWYNDPSCGPVKQVRPDSTKGGYIVMVREFTPPA